MPDETDPPSNIDRLLAHLKEDSLPARLVRAHRESDDSAAAVKQLLVERIKEVRAKLDVRED